MSQKVIGAIRAREAARKSPAPKGAKGKKAEAPAEADSGAADTSSATDASGEAQ